MAGAKRRSPTSTLVSKGSIQKAGSALGDLPAKPKEIWSLREAIDALKDEITLALDRGYTYPEISEMLTERGVEISASTLKYYLSAVKRQDPNSKPRRRRRTLGASLSAESLNLSIGGDAPKKRGRQPKAAKADAAAAPKKRGRQPKAAAATVTTAKKKPGRPPKAAATATTKATTAKKKPGRPPKAAAAATTKVTKATKATKAATTKATTAKKKPGRPPKAAAAAATAKATKGAGRGRKKAKA